MRLFLDRRNLPLMLLVPALALASCGGGDKPSKRQASTGAGAASGATGSASTTGASGATGKHGTARSKRKGAGRQRTPSGGAGSPAARGGGKQTSESKPANGGSNPKAKKKRTKGEPKSKNRPGPRPDYTQMQYELYKQSKVVCRAQTLNAMAAQYHVARTPSAVAAAYAKAYVDTFKTPEVRGAVADGCEDGLS